MIRITFEYRCDFCAEPFGKNEFGIRPMEAVPVPYQVPVYGDRVACPVCSRKIEEQIQKAQLR